MLWWHWNSTVILVSLIRVRHDIAGPQITYWEDMEEGGNLVPTLQNCYRVFEAYYQHTRTLPDTVLLSTQEYIDDRWQPRIESAIWMYIECRHRTLWIHLIHSQHIDVCNERSLRYSINTYAETDPEINWQNHHSQLILQGSPKSH